MSGTDHLDPKVLARRYRDAAPAEQRRMVHAKVRYESRAASHRGWPQSVAHVVAMLTLMPAFTALLKWQWAPQLYGMAAIGFVVGLVFFSMARAREQRWRKDNPFDPDDPANALRTSIFGAPPPTPPAST